MISGFDISIVIHFVFRRCIPCQTKAKLYRKLVTYPILDTCSCKERRDNTDYNLRIVCALPVFFRQRQLLKQQKALKIKAITWRMQKVTPIFRQQLYEKSTCLLVISKVFCFP